MRVWMAGETFAAWRERIVAGVHPSRLFSYHFISSGESMYPEAKTMKEAGKDVKLFLDSGAFSAMTRGVAIDIQEYIAFIKANAGALEVYANLDVIGDPEATWKNQKVMEKAGLHPLPTFHHGEPVSYLKRYVAEYEYIALGGLVGKRAAELQTSLDYYFREFICGPDGTPKVKVHGFGMTALGLMWRYPWYSVDSTAWVMHSRTGSILVPRPDGKGGYDYRKDPWKISTSTSSPSAHTDDFHLDNMSPMVKAVVLAYLKKHKVPLGESELRMVDAGHKLDKEAGEAWHGKRLPDGTRELQVRSVEGVRNHYKWRDYVNVVYYRDLEAAFPKWPRKFVAESMVESGGFGL